MSIIHIFGISILLHLNGVFGTDPSYRPFSGHSGGFEYGYINMKAYPGKKLNMTPFNITTTPDINQCAIDCFTSVIKQCQSVNIEEVQPRLKYKCELMELDKHKAYPHFVDADSNAITHYDIDNSCDAPRPCPSHNHWCIPDHVTGQKQCVCKHNYTGSNCNIVRNTTFTLDTELNGVDNPFLEHPITTSHVTVSMWVYFNRLDYIKAKFVSSICISPSNHSHVIYVQNNGIFDWNPLKEKSTKFGMPSIEKWYHFCLRVDKDNAVTTVYMDGKNVGDFNIGNLDDSTKVATLYFALGTYQDPKDCSQRGMDDGYSLKAAYKEVYIWNRFLDENDIPLIYGKKFIPYGPIIKWDDFKSHANDKVTLTEDINL